MHAMKPLITAGVVAALGLAPAAFAQSSGTAPATQSSQTAAPQPPPSGTSQQQQVSGGGNQEVARQALAAARQSLAELTKLPAASSLQGEQRTAIANFISDFNAFATAQTDWRSKYEVVDESLIGGIAVHIADRLYDASVRNRLERLRARLTAV